MQRSDLDWPEAVFEALTQSENIHGTIATIQSASEVIEHEQEKLNRRRARAYAEVSVASTVDPQVVNGQNDNQDSQTMIAEAQISVEGQVDHVSNHSLADGDGDQHFKRCVSSPSGIKVQRS